METFTIYRVLCDLQSTSASLAQFDPHNSPTRRVWQIFAEHQICPRHCSRPVGATVSLYTCPY